MSFTKVAPVGIGTEPGSSIRIGDSLLHSNGIDLGTGTGIGVTIRQHGDATFTGIVTAASFSGSLTGGASELATNATGTNLTLSGNLGVGAMIDARKDIAARFGVKYDDIVEASDLYRENELFDFDASGRVTAVKGLSKNSSLRNLHPDSILLAVQELQLFEAELNKGIKDVMGNDNELTSKELKKGLENNDPKLLKFLSELADPNSELNQMLNRDYKDFYARPGQFKITDAGAQYLDANKYATMMKSESYIQGLVDSFYIDMEQGVEGKARKKSIIAQIARRFQMGGNEMAFNQIIKDAQFSDEELAAYGLKRVNVLDKDNNIVGTRIEMDPNNMGSEIERLVQEIQLSEKETILLKQEVHKLISTLNPNNYVVQ